MTPVAQGRIVLWQGGSLWTLRVTERPGGPKTTDFHAHHAIQITLAVDGVFDLHLMNRSIAGPALVVAPDVRHAFEPKGVIALLFVEPESPAGQAILGEVLRGEPVAVLPQDILDNVLPQLAEAFSQQAGDERLREVGLGLVRRLAGAGDPRAPDTRVQMSIDWAVDQLDRPLTVSGAAARVGLSVGRMSHLFVEQTGLPFRTYVLWLRLSKAVEDYARGTSLTEAAHNAGFADSAHFSRTFRRMFGVAAAALALA